MTKTKRRASGPTIPESTRRERGTAAVVTVRLLPADLALVDSLRLDGESRGALVTRLARAEAAREKRETPPT